MHMYNSRYAPPQYKNLGFAPTSHASTTPTRSIKCENLYSTQKFKPLGVEVQHVYWVITRSTPKQWRFSIIPHVTSLLKSVTCSLLLVYYRATLAMSFLFLIWDGMCLALISCETLYPTQKLSSMCILTHNSFHIQTMRDSITSSSTLLRQPSPWTQPANLGSSCKERQSKYNCSQQGWI